MHFLWGEFAAPRHPRWFNGRGAKIVASFHCSERRFKQVMGGYRCLGAFDRISVMSRTQVPLFTAAGFPADRIDVTLHGVDCEFFCPLAAPRTASGELRLLLVGSTERDHEFAAAVMRELAAAPVRLSVLTGKGNHAAYAGLDNVSLLPFMDDDALREQYRAADVLFMPLLDCTANNAVLEAMACGTPVLANRVGGIPEYVSEDAGFIMDGKNAGEWAKTVRSWLARRDEVAAKRATARAWAEKFDWKTAVKSFHEFHARALAG